MSKLSHTSPPTIDVEPLLPMREPHWSDGMTEGERADMYAHLAGWFRGTDPAEFEKALAAGREQLKADRARWAALRAAAERRAAREAATAVDDEPHIGNAYWLGRADGIAAERREAGR
ncbi:hypothetical protein [Jiangella mangrovi]|uniref:Uncharacterized protein n=1 Tax=Jiangella mangrovi TaxID=1524084 RepID=A0A7W9GLE6_9ACTN|nr:hypothetical protein [Jiangella mangrovi]MBB5786003.1 hypothetical protein [Jiangella mangrovi]